MRVLSDGSLSAQEAMQRDVELLATGTQPLLRFYQWKSPSITIGVLDEMAALPIEIEIARRPSGGARLLHQHDLAFSLFIPFSTKATFPLTFGYQEIHNALLAGVQALVGIEKERCSLVEVGRRSSRGDFCMAVASYHDPLVDGKKIAGGAQRRTKRAFLHQGSIFLKPPEWSLFSSYIQQHELQEMQKAVISVQEVAPSVAISVEGAIEIFATKLLEYSMPWLREPS